MSVFTIYVVIVTILFAGYYAVTIYKDLRTNKKPEKPAEEVFDISSMREDPAVPVSETAQGFQVGTTEAGAGNEVVPEDGGNDTEMGKETPGAAEEKAEQISENMEDAGIQDEIALNELEFNEFLLSRNKREVLFRDDMPKPKTGPEPGEITI